MQCNFEAHGIFWVCSQCGLTIPKKNDKKPRSTCKGQWTVTKNKPKRNKATTDTSQKKRNCGGCKKKLTKSIIQKSITKSKQTQQIKLQELRDKLDKK